MRRRNTIKEQNKISLKLRFVGLLKTKSLGLLVPVILGAITVLASIQGSASNTALVKVEREIARIESENNTIKQELITASSLSRIQEDTLSLNLIKPSHVVYLNKSEFLAKLP